MKKVFRVRLQIESGRDINIFVQEDILETAIAKAKESFPEAIVILACEEANTIIIA